MKDMKLMEHRHYSATFPIFFYFTPFMLFMVKSF